jgi:YD repeat-containing protein
VNTGSSLKVQYGYSQPTGANYSRLSTMTYPNGRVLDYVYNTGLDSDISRVSGISDASGTGAGNDQSYLYLGLDTIVQATDGNGIALSYIKQPGDTLAGSDAGDQYTGLDRFGRVADQNWVNPSTGVSTDRFQYGYDQSGNVLYKNNLVNSSFSELYHANSTSTGDNSTAYDNLNRITGFRRGTLSASGNNGSTLDTVSTLNTNADSSQSWSLDALGNQTSVTTDGTPTGRTLNGQNQITAVGSSGLAYDNNGNTTTNENGHTLVYDAWNRLIAVKNGSTTLASYVYDANGNRVQQTESSATTDLYYSTRGQVLEERQSGTVTAQNVWGLMYVNQLVLRDSNSTGGSYGLSGSGLGQRIYVQQDADWNVTALVSSTGTVLQRADYTPYGIQAILSPSWATATDAYGVPYSFQGGRQDPVTGLVHFSQGNAGRDFDVYLGTAVEQDAALGVSGVRLTGQLRPNLQPRLVRSQYLDPMLVALTRAGSGYISSFNRYQVEGSNPLQRVDPSGLSWLGALGGGLSGAIIGGVIAGFIVGTGGLGAVVIIGIAAAAGGAGGALLGSPYSSFVAGAAHGVPAGIGAGVLAPAAPVLCPSLLTAAEEAEEDIDAAEGEGATPNYGSTPAGRPLTKHYGTETGPERNIPGSVVDNTVNTTPGVPGRNGTTVYYDPGNNVTVVTGSGGSIVSVHKGAP